MDIWVALVSFSVLVAGDPGSPVPAASQAQGQNLVLESLGAYLPPFRAAKLEMGLFAPGHKHLSPDGGSILVWVGYSRPNWAFTPYRLVLIDPKTGQARNLTKGLFTSVWRPSWGQTGDAVLFWSTWGEYEGPPRPDIEKVIREKGQQWLRYLHPEYPLLWKLNIRTGALYPLAIPRPPPSPPGLKVDLSSPLEPRPGSNQFLLVS